MIGFGGGSTLYFGMSSACGRLLALVYCWSCCFLLLANTRITFVRSFVRLEINLSAAAVAGAAHRTLLSPSNSH